MSVPKIISPPPLRTPLYLGESGLKAPQNAAGPMPLDNPAPLFANLHPTWIGWFTDIYNFINNQSAALTASSTNSAASAGPSTLNGQGLPTVSSPLPSGVPVVAALPGTADPLSVIGNYVIFQGQPYIFTAGLAGPPGYWALDVTVAPSIDDTAANLGLYPAANYPVGTVFRATDWNTSWAVQSIAGVHTWIYYNGIYEDLLANIPMTLGLTEKGFLFRASDYLHNWLWTGTAWSLTAAAQIGFAGGLFPGTLLFSLGGPPFGGSGALWQLCDGSTVPVSQEDATLVNTTVPTIADTWFVR